MRFLLLLDLLPETIALIREIVQAIRKGEIEEAKDAAERAAIVEAFRRRQNSKRKK